jgi:sortase B
MLDGHHKYKVIAAFYSQIYPVKSSQFKYYKQMSITSESEYVSYIRNVKALAEYDTGITPKWGRQLITLSTCAYQVNDGRFAVVAVKIK